VLAAHATFLAHRYGAGAAQLGGGLDVRALLRGRRAYAAARSVAAGGGRGDPRRGLRPADAAGRRVEARGRPPLRPRRQRRCVIDDVT